MSPGLSGKPKVREIHLLVHPLYSRRGDLGERLEAWKSRINYLKRNKGALVLVGLRLSQRERNRSHYDELVDFSAQELGPRFYHALPLSSKKFAAVSGPLSSGERRTASFRREHANEILLRWDFDPKRVKVRAYGEYGNLCVLGNLNNFLREFGLPWSRNIKVDATHSAFSFSEPFFPPRRLFAKGSGKNPSGETVSPEMKRFERACLEIRLFKKGFRPPFSR